MSWREILVPQAPVGPDRSSQDRPALDADDVSAFCHGLAAARDQFGHGVKAFTAQYNVGPRAPWIIGIVGRVQVSPHQLADFFSSGRSLISAELTKLAEAGLIRQVKDPADGRRSTIELTKAGRAAYERLSRELEGFITDRLTGYTPEEVRLCARMLADFSMPRRQD